VKFLAVSVLAFSCVALVLSAVLLWRNNANAQQILKVFGVTTIVGFSALLLIVGYNNDPAHADHRPVRGDRRLLAREGCQGVREVAGAGERHAPPRA
jgi:hypothetical protein